MTEVETLLQHLPLARLISNQSPHKTIPYDDRLQAATIGLLLAIRTYNPARGKWSTYAGTCIWREIERLAAKQSYHLAVPESAARDVRRVAYGRVDGAKGKRRRHTISAITSLPDRPREYRDEHEAAATGADPYDQAIDRIDRHAVADLLLSDLSARERYLCRLHYVEGRTFEQIAEMVGRSRQRIQQVVARAIKKIRRGLARRGQTPILQV